MPTISAARAPLYPSDDLPTMFVLPPRTRRVLVRASPCASGFATVLRRTLDLDLDVRLGSTCGSPSRNYIAVTGRVRVLTISGLRQRSRGEVLAVDAVDE